MTTEASPFFTGFQSILFLLVKLHISLWRDFSWSYPVLAKTDFRVDFHFKNIKIGFYCEEFPRNREIVRIITPYVTWIENHNGLNFKPKIKIINMSELNIRKWLSNITETVKAKDLNRHMDLVSENVAVYGMPSGKTLNYADWQNRRQSEFKRGLIKGLAYNNLKIKTFGLRRLIFDIEEIMDGTNGDLAIINKQVVLEEEQDNKWRVVEETIKNWKFIKGR